MGSSFPGSWFSYIITFGITGKKALCFYFFVLLECPFSPPRKRRFFSCIRTVYITSGVGDTGQEAKNLLAWSMDGQMAGWKVSHITVFPTLSTFHLRSSTPSHTCLRCQPSAPRHRTQGLKAESRSRSPQIRKWSQVNPQECINLHWQVPLRQAPSTVATVLPE